MKNSDHYSLPRLQKFVLEFQRKKGRKLLRKKIGIHRPHLGLCFPRVLLHVVAPPQHFNHRNNFRSQLTHLKIYNLHWLFLVRQLFIYFHTLGLQHVWRVWNILPQHQDMEHWMHLWHIWRQGQPICNHANSLQYPKRSNISRC